MRKAGKIHLTPVTTRLFITIVAVSLMLPLIQSPWLSAQDKCPCGYPFFTSLLDEGKCRTLICTDTSIAVQCQVTKSDQTQTTTSDFVYLYQETGGLALCRTLTDPGRDSSTPSAVIEELFPAKAEGEDCQAILKKACL